LEHMTLSVMHWDVERSLTGSYDPMRAFIEEKFNITFKGKPGLSWDNFWEIPFVWAAAGELPDMIGGIDIAEGAYYDWVRDGLVRAIPSDLSAYPNLAKTVAAPGVRALAVNGKNYLLPRVIIASDSENTFWSETYVNANVSDAKLERILMLFDWLYSDEGINTVYYGFEGRDWAYGADGSIVMLTALHPETGIPKRAPDLYDFCYSLSYLATWGP